MQIDRDWEVVLRLGAATLAGAAVGLNREVLGKPAGLKTHALVSLGAAVATYVAASLNRGAIDGDTEQAVSRAIQGVIAGVGFLGGGAILKSDKETVTGLTTAASIWVVAALGIACGAGMWVASLTAVCLTLAVLLFGGPLEDRLHKRTRGARREENSR